VKEGGGGEGKCERERALERLRCYSPGLEVDPQRSIGREGDVTVHSFFYRSAACFFWTVDHSGCQGDCTWKHHRLTK
jgi:hypothetical protein